MRFFGVPNAEASRSGARRATHSADEGHFGGSHGANSATLDGRKSVELQYVTFNIQKITSMKFHEHPTKPPMNIREYPWTSHEYSMNILHHTVSYGPNLWGELRFSRGRCVGGIKEAEGTTRGRETWHQQTWHSPSDPWNAMKESPSLYTMNSTWWIFNL